MNYKIHLFLTWLIGTTLIAMLVFSTPNLAASDDSYRHITTAYLYRTTDWHTIQTYPWLQFTFPKDNADIWFLFHILLIPFTYAGLLLGAKLAVIFFCGCILYLFLKILSHLEIKRYWLWTLLLLGGSSYFLFRLTFPRALLLDITLVLLIVLSLLKKKAFLTGALSGLFMLANVAAPISFVLAAMFDLSNIIVNRKIQWRYSIYSLLGLIAGSIAHPAFPANIGLFVSQTFGTLLISPAQNIPIGRELNPYTLKEFVGVNGLLSITWLAGLFGAADQTTKWKQDKKRFIIVLWFGLLSLIFFIATISHQRFIEYFAPIAILFTAFTIEPYIIKISWSSPLISAKKRLLISIVGIISIVLLGRTLYRTLDETAVWMHNTPSAYTYKGATDWLKQNSKPGAIVFNTRWDQFPQLFFWNHYNHYIVGMDPTFMYLYHSTAYRKWSIITSERPMAWDRTSVYTPLKNDFRASYVFIEKSSHSGLMSYLDQQTQDFNLVYDDQYTSIFQVN